MASIQPRWGNSAFSVGTAPISRIQKSWMTSDTNSCTSKVQGGGVEGEIWGRAVPIYQEHHCPSLLRLLWPLLSPSSLPEASQHHLPLPGVTVRAFSLGQLDQPNLPSPSSTHALFNTRPSSCGWEDRAPRLLPWPPDSNTHSHQTVVKVALSHN